MWQRLHRITGSVIPIAFGCAIAVYFFVPYAIHCRAEARLTQCRNNLFQHSGSHLCDSVTVDENFNVIGVGSCPLCSHAPAGVSYSVGKPEKGYALFIRYIREDELPPSAIAEGQRHLYAFKAAPRYHELRKRFSDKKHENLRKRLYGHAEAHVDQQQL